jgi:hypothetical protein
MRVFLKKEDLVLLNGGYLTRKETGEPVFNEEFVALQKRMEYIITFNEIASKKDFKGKKPDLLEEVEAETLAFLRKNNEVEFISIPKKPTSKLQDSLAAEAMAFMNFTDESAKIKEINKFLKEFIIIKDFEDFGLFFEEGVVKLNRIYTLKELINSLKNSSKTF